MMENSDEQQFCLRWNNFQANITSQFETLRDDEDFTDVTIACEGQRIQAHKVVLSACSPYFKELFKNNPCSHPIIFMRDVEARHVVALMEFMYAGEVNVAQAHLPAFLKTAESLRIRGLTDTSPDCNQRDEDWQQASSSKMPSKVKNQSPCSTVTSSQDIGSDSHNKNASSPLPITKKHNNINGDKLFDEQRLKNEEIASPFPLSESGDIEIEVSKPPKEEMQEYISDDEKDDPRFFHLNTEATTFTGGMEIIPQNPNMKDAIGSESAIGRKLLHPRICEECGRVFHSYDNLRHHIKLMHYPAVAKLPDLNCINIHKVNNIKYSGKSGVKTKFSSQVCPIKHCPIRLRHRRSSEAWNDGNYQSGTKSPDIVSRLRDKRNRLVKLGEGIEIYEDQLKSVKWSDYRKLTRGLATILFSPAELATCSVTGQRWSRAGSGERPVKPALDRAKVQAIISYVATRFPMVEISRIKQVLAYKCKENSTAFKMKAVRYLGEQIREPDKLN